MKTFGEIVFGGNIQLSSQVLSNVNDRVILTVLRYLFKFGKIEKKSGTTRSGKYRGYGALQPNFWPKRLYVFWYMRTRTCIK